MDRKAILALVAGLSEKHILKRSPPSYVEGFADAILNVYPPGSISSVLQQKFHIPDETNYSDKTYLELACELTVANHVKLTGHPNFEAEKQLNLPLEKDVDAYCDVGAYHPAVEVKCPELKVEVFDPAKPVIQVKFLGRLPDYQKQFDDLQALVGAAANLKMAKRDDNKLKDYLVQANDKFRKPPQAGDVNVLFIPLDDYYSMQDWNGFLFSDFGGFFSQNPYIPGSQYALVDLVVLSNLQSAHTIGRDHHDWTLKNIFMIPRFTRNPRPGLTDQAIAAALSLFPHELAGFNAYQSYSGTDETADTASRFLKITDYAVSQLSSEDRARYFPVPTPLMRSQAESAAREAAKQGQTK